MSPMVTRVRAWRMRGRVEEGGVEVAPARSREGAGASGSSEGGKRRAWSWAEAD